MSNKIVLSTERLILRPFEDRDFYEFCEYISDNRVNRGLGILNPESLNTKEKLFKANIENPLCWAVELRNSKKIIGDFHFDNIVENYLAHFGFALNYDYQKKGYAFEASERIVEFGQEVLNFGRIRAISLIQNIASIKLLEKLGFEKEALIYDYDFGGMIGDVFYLSKKL